MIPETPYDKMKNNAESTSTAVDIANLLYYDAQVKEVMCKDPILLKRLVEKYEGLTRSDLASFHARQQIMSYTQPEWKGYKCRDCGKRPAHSGLGGMFYCRKHYEKRKADGETNYDYI